MPKSTAHAWGVIRSNRPRRTELRRRQSIKWQAGSRGKSAHARLSRRAIQRKCYTAHCLPLQKSGKTHDNLELLPVGSSHGGRKQRFVWDGKAIKVIDTEELASKQTKRQHLTAQLRDWRSSVLSAFLPDKELVTADYWGYSFWRNSHRFFSSATTVFATQVPVFLLQCLHHTARYKQNHRTMTKAAQWHLPPACINITSMCNINVKHAPQANS